jgi:hypothetical protein
MTTAKDTALEKYCHESWWNHDSIQYEFDWVFVGRSLIYFVAAEVDVGATTVLVLPLWPVQFALHGRIGQSPWPPFFRQG